MASKIDPKSIKNRGCVAYAFLERAKPPTFFGCHLATIFDQKSKKWHPKRHPKINAEKVSKNHEKSIQNDVKMDAQINDF